MLTRFTIALLAVACSACSTVPAHNPNAQPKVSFENSVGLVQWHKLTHEGVQQTCSTANDNWVYAACYKMVDNVCHVYSEDKPEAMAALGHELKHCFDGLFHDTKGKWFTLTVDPATGRKTMSHTEADGAANYLFR